MYMGPTCSWVLTALAAWSISAAKTNPCLGMVLHCNLECMLSCRSVATQMLEPHAWHHIGKSYFKNRIKVKHRLVLLR